MLKLMVNGFPMASIVLSYVNMDGTAPMFAFEGMGFQIVLMKYPEMWMLNVEQVG